MDETRREGQARSRNVLGKVAAPKKYEKVALFEENIQPITIEENITVTARHAQNTELFTVIPRGFALSMHHPI